MHAEWTIKALEAGIPVLCEKPFASNAAEAQEMVNASKKTGVLLGEAFMYRFHPIYDQVLDRIANGAIGDLVSISSTFKFTLTDRTNIRAIGELAGGALMDVGCYCVNLSRRIVGTQPVRIHAFERRTTVDDTLFGTLEFANGVVAQIECSIESRSARGAEIAGTEGLIVLDSPWFPGDDSAKFTIYSGDKQEVVQTPGANSYQLEVDDFTAALRTRRPLRWGPDDAVENMVVVDALYKSARQQAVVDL
jgi:predicted dehydrogenase